MEATTFQCEYGDEVWRLDSAMRIFNIRLEAFHIKILMVDTGT